MSELISNEVPVLEKDEINAPTIDVPSIDSIKENPDLVYYFKTEQGLQNEKLSFLIEFSPTEFSKTVTVRTAYFAKGGIRESFGSDIMGVYEVNGVVRINEYKIAGKELEMLSSDDFKAMKTNIAAPLNDRPVSLRRGTRKNRRNVRKNRRSSRRN